MVAPKPVTVSGVDAEALGTLYDAAPEEVIDAIWRRLEVGAKPKRAGRPKHLYFVRMLAQDRRSCDLACSRRRGRFIAGSCTSALRRRR